MSEHELKTGELSIGLDDNRNEQDRLERHLSREASLVEQFPSVDKLKIGIIGVSDHSGASFITGCLARYLANTRKHSPAVIELGSASLFDSYGMDKRFAGRQYFRFYHALEINKSIRGMRNLDEGVNWILRSPEEIKIKLTYEQKLRLTNHAKGDVLLCDLSGEINPDLGLLQNMDQVLAVIDPLPSKMLKGHELLRTLKELYSDRGDVIYVINRYNRGVNKRQMLGFLNVKKPVVVPLINPEIIYTAEYNCKIPYTLGEVKNILREPLTEIVSLLNF